MSTTQQSDATINDEKQNEEESSSSFLKEAVAAAMTTQEMPDIENQNQQQLQRSPLPPTNHSIGILAPHKSHHHSTNNEEDDNNNNSSNSSSTNSVGSVFSFDSYEMKGLYNKFHSITTTGAATIGTSNNNIPFPSVTAAAASNNTTNLSIPLRNICPCQCLFFTVKETICLVMSALGCAVFLAGLVVLCLYLEGSLFEGEMD